MGLGPLEEEESDLGCVRFRLLNWANHSRQQAMFGSTNHRHSKILTSKGLRDRRVRLSVPTAIQFYDLQDRLGCDQSSKVIDWLIQGAADAIAELPLLSLAASARTLSAVAAPASLPFLQFSNLSPFPWPCKKPEVERLFEGHVLNGIGGIGAGFSLGDDFF
ncbi:hypothetical protein MRB53_015814 [Persea americana]|uniref:Uncharacterized protein n=1 Tax=Persea americana TaxID=3435 RepID=A0ACC2M0G6_PERAE|nr:hypothetical protein MRB53_015814 [Persea americana]